MTVYRAAVAHRAGEDRNRRINGHPVVHCQDCHWAQALDEHLHQGPFGLIYWHADHPEDAVDHLAALPDRFAVPAYVQWWAQAHFLAIEDKRTEESVLFSPDCLEIFRSVAADGDLEQAVRANTHRQRIFPPTSRTNIEDVAAGLFRTGLLRPARGL